MQQLPYCLYCFLLANIYYVSDLCTDSRCENGFASPQNPPFVDKAVCIQLMLQRDTQSQATLAGRAGPILHEIQRGQVDQQVVDTSIQRRSTWSEIGCRYSNLGWMGGWYEHWSSRCWWLVFPVSIGQVYDVCAPGCNRLCAPGNR